jgi:uncharacterized protein (DUF433 family)
MAAQPFSDRGDVDFDLAPVPLPLKRWDDGSIRVGGTRLTLDSVVTAFTKREYTAEQIAERFGPIPVEVIYATLAFYLANRDLIDAYVERRESDAEARWAEMAADPRVGETQARLRRAPAEHVAGPR